MKYLPDGKLNGDVWSVDYGPQFGKTQFFAMQPLDMLTFGGRTLAGLSISERYLKISYFLEQSVNGHKILVCKIQNGP